ncbi:MAG: ABC transporter ATP-binding protein [Actinomycetota bacterium]|nr:ABC transporter ATP-binding protein [Actinomycetota bacterium]
MTKAAATDALAIETTGLTKRFGEQVVVDDLDLAVPQGSVFGFLGPNGSGKTTTIRMLLGLAFPSAGRIRLLGRPPTESDVLTSVGAVIEGPAFYPYLSGRSNLRRLDAVGPGPGRAGRRQRVDDALERVGLTGAATKRTKAYSLGMKQRLALAAALVRPVELLVLDEPTNGLDPQGTREVRNLVRKLAADGATVFLSSHLLSEIEQVCTHAVVLFNGRTVAQGTLPELREAQRATLRVETPDPAQALATLRAIAGIGLVQQADDEVTHANTTVLNAELVGAAPEDVTAALVGAGVRVRALHSVQPTLEDLFVALTGEGFDVAQ